MQAQATAVEQEMADCHQAALKLQQENSQLLVDQQAFSRQNEQLVGQLAALEDALQLEGAERNAAHQELASTRLMLGGIERSREIVQRDVAGATQQVATLQAKLLEVTRENQGVQQQLELERARTVQLEMLASTLRQTSMQESSAKAETEQEANTAQSERRTLAEENAQLEVELRLLRRAHEDQVRGTQRFPHPARTPHRIPPRRLSCSAPPPAAPACHPAHHHISLQVNELATLRRALGTASFERDANAKQLEAMRDLEQQEGTSKEAFQRQCEVIKELDAERSKLRGEVERTAQRCDVAAQENERLVRQLQAARDAHETLQAGLVAREDALKAAEAERDAAQRQQAAAEAAREQSAATGQAAADLALQAERTAAEAHDAMKQLAAERARAGELSAAHGAAQRKVRMQEEELQAMQDDATAAQERYTVLLRQHELLIESEHELRLRLQHGHDAAADLAVDELAASGGAALSAQLRPSPLAPPARKNRHSHKCGCTSSDHSFA